MIRFSLKGMAGRKLRTALTALAVILGVTMVSGTFVLTDSIDRAFDAIFSSVYEGTDATITGKSAFDLSDGSGTTAPPFDESLQPEVAALPDVAAAIGGVAGEAQLIGEDGKAIVFGGAPNLGFSVDPTKPEFNTLTLEDGAWPADGEVVIDVATASKKDLSVGDAIGVQAEGPVEQFKISGLVKFGSVDTIGGATLAGFNLADSAGALPEGRQARPDPRCGQAGRLAEAARLGDQRDPARRVRRCEPAPSRPPRTRRTPTSSSRFSATSCSRSA